MSTRPVHLTRLSALGLVAVVLGVAVVLAESTGPNRAAVLSALQRPAPAAPARATTRFALHEAGYRVTVELSPNIASTPNRLSVAVTRNGRPVDLARVRVTYSMPAMNMWNAFSSSFGSDRTGSYVATEPVLGMAGLWQLRFTVLEHGGRRLTAVIDDRLHS